MKIIDTFSFLCLQVWIFGKVLCKTWLAVDVWMCTASILNLCAISLDRYVAVSHPVTYPNIMSMKKAKILVCLVWVLSFVICLPPLIGWKSETSIGNQSLLLNETVIPPCPWICELTSDTGYVVYSAMGSFYIPAFVMLFFYWRIYRAAIQTTRAINQGFRTTKTMRNRFDESRLTLRIHRGRGSSVRNHSATPSGCANSNCALQLSNANNIETAPFLRSPDSSRYRRCSVRRPERGHEKVKISVSYPSSDGLNSLLGANGSASATLGAGDMNRSGSISSSSPSNSSNLYAHCGCTDGNSFYHSTAPTSHLRVGGGRLSETTPRRCSTGDTIVKPRHLSEQLLLPMSKGLSPAPSYEDNAKPKLIAKANRRNMKARSIKTQVKRFRMETKAAKTLGIIVGGFVICWLPFFTLYLIRAFCDWCVPPAVFSVMFWLGYCNSAINPMIYALFSKDFRFAFRRIIYSCFSRNFSLNDSKNMRRGSEGSQLGVCKRNDRSPSCNDFPMLNMSTGNVNSESEIPLTDR